MGTRSAVGSIMMAMTGRISNQLDADETGTPVADLGDSIAEAYTTGTSASQFDRIWSDKGRALSSGNSEDIDLYDFAGEDVGAGDGNDALGQALTLAEIVTIMIRNQSGSTGLLTVGAKGDSTEWESLFGDGSTILLKPGNLIMASAVADPAWVVTDTTGHILKFAASGGDLVYDVHIFGRSA